MFCPECGKEVKKVVCIQAYPGECPGDAFKCESCNCISMVQPLDDEDFEQLKEDMGYDEDDYE